MIEWGMSKNELEKMAYEERITFRLPVKHKEMLEREAVLRHGTMGDVLREAVREWVEKRGESRRK